MEPQFDAGIDSPADASPTPTTPATRRLPAWVTRPTPGSSPAF
ncbi:hypothetical protein JD77_06335 [Micromonospora olivasterospora]|uniref:Uncharacterized protein n=1 Tax=Micromonospora olivasterospora TaxID=1880 RepID=A0A562HUY2_MICOL|nr:hypothetical protein JD77_06335 [Micromonospora olivasterospora]